MSRIEMSSQGAGLDRKEEEGAKYSKPDTEGHVPCAFVEIKITPSKTKPQSSVAKGSKEVISIKVRIMVAFRDRGEGGVPQERQCCPS